MSAVPSVLRRSFRPFGVRHSTLACPVRISFSCGLRPSGAIASLESRCAHRPHPLWNADSVLPAFGGAMRSAQKSKDTMGHYCRVCGSVRPNEAFSGKGHRNHVCKECTRMPKEERESLEQSEEIFGFLKQSHISDGNVARLRTLAGSSNPRIAELASITLEVALVKPHKKLRLKFLARERRDLLEKLRETGLILAHHW